MSSSLMLELEFEFEFEFELDLALGSSLLVTTLHVPILFRELAAFLSAIC